MMNPNVLPEFRDFIERAEAAYQQFYVGQLQETLERTAWGKYLAIHMDTGQYVLADTDDEVMTRFRARFPDAIPYTLRIGMPTTIA